MLSVPQAATLVVPGLAVRFSVCLSVYPLRAAMRQRRDRDAHRRQPRKQGLTVRHAGVPMAASRCITPAAQHVMDGATDSQWH